MDMTDQVVISDDGAPWEDANGPEPGSIAEDRALALIDQYRARDEALKEARPTRSLSPHGSREIREGRKYSGRARRG